MTRSRTVRAAAAGVAALVLSACSVHPGSAAVVGSETISQGNLDDVATALCAAQSSGTPGQELSTRAARQGALDVLISGALSRQFGASRHVTPSASQVSSALSQSAQTVASVPAASRPAFRATIKEYAEGQLTLISIGSKALQQRGTSSPSQQQAVAVGTTLRNAWARKNLTVSVDPRYGTYSQGQVQGASDGSLSVPVSSRARAGAATNPPASWVSALPATQKCS